MWCLESWIRGRQRQLLDPSPSPTPQAGAAAAYLLDAAGVREAALFAVWAALAATNAGLLLTGAAAPRGRPLPLAALAIAFNGVTLLVSGGWATLQFRWVQTHHPAATLALERAVVGASLPLGAAAIALTTLTSLSPHAAPFATAAALGGLYYALATPLPSSFAAGGAKARPLVARGDAARAAVLFILLPPLQYTCIHRRLLAQDVHASALLLLASAPMLALAVPPAGLWWAPVSPRGARALRRLLVILAASATVLGFEFRVLFRAAGQYIALLPPWSYVVTTAAALPAGVALALHAAGLATDTDASDAGPSRGDAVTAAAVGPALVIAAGAGGLAAGMQVWAVPAPLAAAAGLALYWESSSLRDYTVFAGGCLASLAWFGYHHYGFLDPATHDGAALRSAVTAAVALAAPALALPAAAAAAARRGGGGGVAAAARAATGGALIACVAALTLVEQRLFAGDASPDADSGPELYPAYAVVATSVALVAAARALGKAGLAPPSVAAVAVAAAAAKMCMVLLPDARPAPSVAAYAAAVTPAVRGLWDARQSEGGGGAATLSVGGATVASAAAVAAAWFSRAVAFDALADAAGFPPSDGAAAGAVLLAAAAPALAAAVAAGVGGAPRRAAAAAAAAGTLALVVGPALPSALASTINATLWDSGHIPDAGVWTLDDGGDAGTGGGWLIVAGGAAAAAAAAGGRPRAAAALAAAQSVALAAGAAALVGAYVAGASLPGVPAAQAGLLASAVTLALATLTARSRGRAAGAALVVSLLGWAGALTAAGLALRAFPPRGHAPPRLFPDADAAAADDAAAAARAALLTVAAAECLLLALAFKLRCSAAARGDSGGGARSRRGGGAPLAPFLAACLPPGAAPFAAAAAAVTTAGPAGAAARALAPAGLAWLPTAANAAAVGGYSLLLASAGGPAAAPPALLALAPVALLLLGPDAALAPWLEDGVRYGPPSAAAALTLTWHAVSGLAADAGARVQAAAAGFPDLDGGVGMMRSKRAPAVARAAFLVAAAVAPHAVLAPCAWRAGRPPHPLAAIAVTPLAVLAAIASPLESARWLAVGGVVGLAAAVVGARGARRAGQRAL